MEHAEALKIGQVRARQAAEAIEKWTGATACAVCAVKPVAGADDGRSDDWEPVGEKSWKEVARDDGLSGAGGYHLMVVDKDGVPKASTVQRFTLAEVLALAELLPMPVWDPGQGELWGLIRREEERRNARGWAVRLDA